MRKFRIAAVILIAALAVPFLSAPAFAAYPTKAIQFIIPFGAGGGADIEGRILAKGMSKVLGVPVVPINKVGGGGAVTYTYVKNAKPDGYTIAWNSTSVLTSTNIGNVAFSYKALDHVGRVEVQSLPFVVKSTSKWKTFESFVADCHENPGKLKVANAGIGSSTHLGAVAIMNAAGCEVIHLPVGIKRRNASVLSGEADAMVAPLTGAIRLARAGKMRILAIPGTKRNPVIPNVPTMSDLGYDVEIDFFRGLSVPKGTPHLVKAILADALMRSARSNKFTAFAKKKGFTIAPLDSESFGAYLATQNKLIIAIMKDAGIYQSKRK